jgi:hypothetical protein
MVDIFGVAECSSVGAIPGPPGLDGVRGIEDLIVWFPELTLEQIRRKLNSLTLLIQTLPPEKDPDVELSSEQMVTKWKSFHHSKDFYVILTPVNKEKGAKLKKLSLTLDDIQRYGLVFDKKKQNMYHWENAGHMFLSYNGINTLLTLTFLAGEYNNKNDEDSEEFIVSDYRWSQWDKSADKFRGVSIKSKYGNKFDLYLHGVSGNKNNTLLIGKDIKKDYFYTLQIYWSNENVGFYVLYKYTEVLIEKTFFKHTEGPTLTTPAFYLGGFNAATREEDEVIISKCFTGIISNLEIINTNESSIPTQMLEFIIENQIIDSSLSQFHETVKEEDTPPSVKKKKVT